MNANSTVECGSVSRAFFFLDDKLGSLSRFRWQQRMVNTPRTCWDVLAVFGFLLAFEFLVKRISTISLACFSVMLCFLGVSPSSWGNLATASIWFFWAPRLWRSWMMQMFLRCDSFILSDTCQQLDRNAAQCGCFAGSRWQFSYQSGQTASRNETCTA